jgi:hypothetical protein
MKTIKLLKRTYGKGQRNAYTPTLVNWNNVCHAGYESEYKKAEPPFNSVKNDDWNKFTTIHMMDGKTIQVKEPLELIMKKLKLSAETTHSVFEKEVVNG